MTVGVRGAFADRGDDGTLVGGGVRLTFFPTGTSFSSGLYLSPNFDLGALMRGSWSQFGIAYGARIGYQWYYESGFHMMLGAGVDKYEVSHSSRLSKVMPGIEFRLGFSI
jgi:hypothetical protein